QDSGEIHILHNAAIGPFSTQLSFRTGTGLYGTAQEEDSLTVESREVPIALVTGTFCGGATPDLIVLNSGGDRFDLLAGDGHGGVFNPVTSLTYRTGWAPSAIVSGDFNSDGVPDLAILNRLSGNVLIYVGDGKGGFVPH